MDVLFDEDEDIFVSDADKYFLFLCSEHLYAIEALSVVEIVQYASLTKVPRMNKALKGVINLRGEIIAVLDLQYRFSQEVTQIQSRSALVVVKVKYEEKDLKVALLIDMIHEVDTLDEESFINTPEFGMPIRSDFIKYISNYEATDLFILNLEKLLNVTEISTLEEVL